MYDTDTKINIFNFLRIFLFYMQAFEIGCDMLSILTSRQGFVNTVAKQGALWRLLWILERPGGSDESSRDLPSKDDMLKKQRGWNFLESLSSSTSIAPKILESSAWLELLGILVGYSEFTKIWIARIGAAKILSRLLWDPKTGQTLGRFDRKVHDGQSIFYYSISHLLYPLISSCHIFSITTGTFPSHESNCCFEGRGPRYNVESF